MIAFIVIITITLLLYTLSRRQREDERNLTQIHDNKLDI